MKFKEFYFAVRKTEGAEWIDLNAWGYLPVTARDKARDCDKNLPLWTPANPVVRIAKFELVEKESINMKKAECLLCLEALSHEISP